MGSLQRLLAQGAGPTRCGRVKDLDALSHRISLHSRLKEFVGRFNGVSKRRLQRYLDWFCYREQFCSFAGGRRELLYAHEASAHYRSTWVLTHLEPVLSFTA